MSRRHAPLALFLAAAFALTTASCSSTTTAHHASAAAARSSPAQAAGSPSSAAGAPSAAGSPSAPPDPWQAWCYGGYLDLVAVDGDLQKISTDVGNGMYGSAAQDGQQLVTDAAKGQLDPPPESRKRAAEYVSWMKEAGYTGAAYAQYDTATAEYSTQQSFQYKPAAQEAADKCAAEGA